MNDDVLLFVTETVTKGPSLSAFPINNHFKREVASNTIH